MTFYAPRNIGPADQILFDSDGNAVGIQPAASSSPPVLGFNPTTHAAIESLVSGAGSLALSKVRNPAALAKLARRLVQARTRPVLGGAFGNSMTQGTGTSSFGTQLATPYGVGHWGIMTGISNLNSAGNWVAQVNLDGRLDGLHVALAGRVGGGRHDPAP